MSVWNDSDLRCDAFLGGALHLWQPREGYRAGLDPVLLAASVAAVPGQSVLDLGCGAGAAALCLGARVRDLDLSGIERHAGYAELARRNGLAAGQKFVVETGDLAEMSASLKARRFDHVIANPPYYDRKTGSAAPNADREIALGQDTDFGEWVKAASKRAKPGGYVHFVLKADRLGDALGAFQTRLGSLVIQPLSARAGRQASLILLRGRKEGRAALRLNSPIILHEGPSHPGDKDHYTPEISQVLRHANALEW